MNTGVLLLIIFFLFIFANVPIAVSLSLSAIIGLKIAGFSLDMYPSIMYTAVSKYVLLAIPFFILAGTIMEYAGISKRLIKFAMACVGHTKSGLISVVVVTSCFFAAISGSGPATVAALGGILIPAMDEAGYDKAVAAALMASAGAIGIIIPPSIAFVVYASIAEVSVGMLFLAGFLPGICVGIAYVVAAVWSERKNKNIIRMPKASGKERWLAFKDAFWGIMTPVIILGGIYGGIFTPTEAAGVAVIYGLIVGIFIYREVKIKEFWSIFVDAGVSSATVMFIIAGAAIFGWLLNADNIATSASNGLIALAGDNKFLILLIIDIIFLIAGCFLDGNSAIYVIVPIMIPVARAFNIDLIHFGLFLTVNIAIGLITPPVGIDLYVACSIADITVADICRKIVPFVICGVIALLLLTYIPEIALFLPRLAGYTG
ncbi:MAG: TRAP transporter large permease [Lachnospiraceae bacterium]|nr:TRAP transporter large permease [Lachnospiraceae bacterium]